MRNVKTENPSVRPSAVEEPRRRRGVAETELCHKLDLLLRTGSLLMESAADTSRILRTMKRAMAFLGLDERYIHLYVNWNVLMVNYSDELHSFTKFQRCERPGISLATIAKVSRLTWTAIREDFSLVQYEKALDDIHDAPRGFTPWQVAIGGGFACGGFCIQFGCDWTAFFYCSLAAILGFRLRMFLPTMGCNNYVAIGISAFVATLLAWATALLSTDPAMMAGMPSWMISTTPWHPLMACALFIVPGVPLINFVSDMLDGYIETGFIRAVNTLLMVLAMAFGIAFAIKVCGIDNFAKTLIAFIHAYPHVRLNIVYRSMQELMDGLKKRELDLVLAFKPLKRDKVIDSRAIFSNRLAAIVNDHHPLARQQSVTLADLERYDLILPYKGLQARNAFGHLLEGRDNNFKIMVEVNNVNIIFDLLSRSSLVSILSESTTLTQPGMKAIPIDAEGNEMDGCVHLLRDSYMKSSAQEFIRMLSQSTALLANLAFKDILR